MIQIPDATTAATIIAVHKIPSQSPRSSRCMDRHIYVLYRLILMFSYTTFPSKTVQTARQSFSSINFMAILLSVLGVLTPTTGALVHNAGSCFVVLLAALLYDRKYR